MTIKSAWGRVKAIQMPPSFAIKLLQGNFRANLPKDARVVEGFDDPWTKDIVFIIESQEFEPVPEGEQYPVFDFEAHYKEG
jgi:hypothetical protein